MAASPASPAPALPAPRVPVAIRVATMADVPLVLAPVKKERAPKKPAAKIDPAFLAKARGLRDRWLEHVNEAKLIGQGKYDVTRTLAKPSTPPTPLLAA